MEISIDKNPIMFRERTIIKVWVDGVFQPFYQSTGRASGKPGVWFPFDGCDAGGWFIKDKYCYNFLTGITEEFHRYGTSKLKEVSKYLSTQEIIAEKTLDNPADVNYYLFGE